MKNIANKIIDKKYFIFLTLLAILNMMFVIYFSTLSYYNRLHFDDYSFLWGIRDKGSIKYLIDVYYGLSGRFMAYLYILLYTKVILWTGSYFILPIINLAIGAFLLCSVFVTILKQLSKFLVINITLLLYNIFCLTNIDFPILFWLCAMSYILIPIVFIFLLQLIIKGRLFLDRVYIVITSLVIGGGLEVFTPTALFILFVLFIFYLRLHSFETREIFQSYIVKNIVLSASIVFLSFLFVLSAPGNYLRMDMGQEFVHPSNVSEYFTHSVKAMTTYFYFIIFYVPYYCVLSVLFVFLGIKSQKNKCYISYTRIFSYTLVLYLIIVLFSVVQNVYLMNNFGLQRTYTHTVFFTALFFAVNGFYLGLYFFKEKHENKVLLTIIPLLLMMIFIMSNNLKDDLPVAKKYAQSVDSRIKNLEEFRNNGNVKLVTLPQLHKPEVADAKYNILNFIDAKGNKKALLYYTSEISSDSTGVSIHQKKYMKLKYNIRVEK